MELQHFFQIVLRRKWLLLLVLFSAAALAWYLVGLQPPTYTSNATVESGVITKTGIGLERDNPFVQEFLVESEFSDLITSLTSRNSMRLLTYRLLLHDLKAEQEGEEPFRTPVFDEDEPIPYSEEDIDSLTNIIIAKQDSILNGTFTRREEKMIKDLAKAYEYDFESLEEKLSIARIGDTDYLKVEFESENPELCVFAVNTYLEEAINYRDNLQLQDESTSVRFYQKLAVAKKKELDDLNYNISNYKKNRSIIDLEEQSKTTIQQIKELELQREEANKTIVGYQKAIANVDRYIDKEKLELSTNYANSIFRNEDVRRLREEVTLLNEQYISDGRKNPAIKARLEVKRKELSSIIGKMADETTRGIRVDKKDDKPEEFLRDRIEKEAELSLAEESVISIDKEIQRLGQKAQSFVSDEAYLENLRGEKEIALNEYLNVKEKYNDALRITTGSTSPLKVFEQAQLPEEPEPSQRPLIAAFAGIAAMSICIMILFLLTFFDSSLRSPGQFEKFAKVNLLGTLNKIKGKNIDLTHLFDSYTKDRKMEQFKESLRKLRFKIENSGATSFLITSPKQQEGKSFTIVALAHSLSLNNKKVLIIDTNFKNNTLTDLSNKTLLNNPLNNGYQPANTKARGLKTNLTFNQNVDIIGNRGGNHSPSEILAGKDFKRVLQGFGQKYDYIFLEGAALNEYSDTHELVSYVDKVIAVFDAEHDLKPTDRASISFLNELNGKFMGGILNNVDLKNLN